MAVFFARKAGELLFYGILGIPAAIFYDKEF